MSDTADEARLLVEDELYLRDKEEQEKQATKREAHIKRMEILVCFLYGVIVTLLVGSVAMASLVDNVSR